MQWDVAPGPAWAHVMALPRTSAPLLEVRSVPTDPGVYAWFSASDPVYAGKASGRGGIRDRLSKHLGLGTDLSRSSLRRNVAEYLLGIPTSVSRQRPTVISSEHVSAINEWIRGLEVAWMVLPAAPEAIAFERKLLGEWMPPLSKR